MRFVRRAWLSMLVALLPTAIAQGEPQKAGPPRSLRTPLAPETLELLANELSGQIVYNNLVKTAGAPWLRAAQEHPGVFYESQTIYDMVRAYAVQTTRLERQAAKGTYAYPTEGKLWIVEPQRRLVARLEADPALVAAGSTTADVTGELVYLAPNQKIAAKTDDYRGKIALMWSHPGDGQAKILAEAGVRAVVAFNSRERYFDPNQVVYSSGAYGSHEPLSLGMSISWRQWSELLEDLHLGRRIVVRAQARVEQFPHKFETVYSWIPGTEPKAKGVVLSAHLFDGYVKRGANDNMSGCVIELEILRALAHLIDAGQLPRPRRTIHFLWPQEISGTYAFLREHSDFADRVSVNLNMDMVGEGLRKNNGVLRMSECPSHLPSYIDGLTRSVMEYVWRTNDIIFLAETRGRPGGQYFPIPLMEKNGSLDAFHYSIQPTVGGTDHVCFINPSMAVPGVSLIVWPDQWYHADTDTPDKADATQLKRAAFIGAACAWAVANCTDEVAAGLAEVASNYGYSRVAEREIPRAMARLAAAQADDLPMQEAQALRLVTFAADREIGALRSIEEIYSGSPSARRAVETKVRQWEAYRAALRGQVIQCAGMEPRPEQVKPEYLRIRPAISPAVKGREFDLAASDRYRQYLEQHPDAMKSIALSRRQATTLLNYVNGRRSIVELRDSVAAELDEEVPLPGVVAYLDLLRAVGWVMFE